VAGEGRRVEFHGLSVEQGTVALAAVGRLTQARFLLAVYGVAVGADEMEWGVHGRGHPGSWCSSGISGRNAMVQGKAGPRCGLLTADCWQGGLPFVAVLPKMAGNACRGRHRASSKAVKNHADAAM